MLSELLNTIENSAKLVFLDKYGQGEKENFNFNVYENVASSRYDVEKGEQNLVNSKKKQILNLKFVVSDKANFSELGMRSVRYDFLIKLKERLQNKRIFSSIEVKTERSGKNPTIVVTHNSVKLNLSLKYLGEDIKKISSIKPSNIKSIAGQWLTPEDFKKQILEYIEGESFFTKDKNIKEQYVNAVEQSTTNSIDVENLAIYSDLSSEFFEILSALKIATLIKKGNKDILNIIGFSGKNKKQIIKFDPKNIKIFIPLSATVALYDYLISYKKEQSLEIKNCLKISVKSRVAGSSVATVKFNSFFQSENEVEEWFQKLGSKSTILKKKNINQKIVAKSSISLLKTKKETLYPIVAIEKMVNGKDNSGIPNKVIVNDIQTYFNMDTESLKKITKIVSKALSNNNYKSYEPLDSIFDTKKRDDTLLLIKTKNFISENLIKNKKYNINIDFKLLGNKYVIEGTNEFYPFTLNNFAYLCEKFLVKVSTENNFQQREKINFYQLFYDNVLVEKVIIYSIIERDKQLSTEKDIIKYRFLSNQNFDSYKKWIALRSKNHPFNMQDSLGLNV